MLITSTQNNWILLKQTLINVEHHTTNISYPFPLESEFWVLSSIQKVPDEPLRYYTVSELIQSVRLNFIISSAVKMIDVDHRVPTLDCTPSDHQFLDSHLVFVAYSHRFCPSNW